MPKDGVLASLETAMSDPGSFKSGEYLEEHVSLYAKQFLQTDRLGLIEALREWIILKREPQMMLAVRLAKDLGLNEMYQDIETLRQELSVKSEYPRFYLRDIDEVLNSLL